MTDKFKLAGVQRLHEDSGGLFNKRTQHISQSFWTTSKSNQSTGRRKVTICGSLLYPQSSLRSG